MAADATDKKLELCKLWGRKSIQQSGKFIFEKDFELQQMASKVPFLQVPTLLIAQSSFG